MISVAPNQPRDRQKRTRAPRMSEWQKHAEKITRKKAVASPLILNLTDVCDATGLSPETVMSYVQRTSSTVKGAMAHLMRPAFQVGAATPWWSQQQVDAYFTATGEEVRERAEQTAGLPEVDHFEAERQELWTLRRLSRWAGFATVTFARMANEAGFPPPAAVAKSRGPRPYKLRKRGDVEQWLRAHRPGWEPADVQDDDPQQ